MDRRSQQNHIRAARDWLGRAEDSISRENDVQGDLKLMLAQAELAHVRSCPRSRRLLLWGRRFAALLVAIGLVAVVWQPAKDPGLVDPVVTDNHTVAVSTEQPVGIEDAPTENQPEDKPTSPAVEPKESYPSQNSAVTEAAAARPAETETAQVTPPQVTEPQLPDAAKQQLMQSAGKILRQ